MMMSSFSLFVISVIMSDMVWQLGRIRLLCFLNRWLDVKCVKVSCSGLVRIRLIVIRQVIDIWNCVMSELGIMNGRFRILISRILMMERIYGLELMMLVQVQVCSSLSRLLCLSILCSLKLMLVISGLFYLVCLVVCFVGCGVGRLLQLQMLFWYCVWYLDWVRFVGVYIVCGNC